MTIGTSNRLEIVLPLTAFTAGSVDVISFARLGGVFASAMTGNVAFLGLYSAAGAWHSAIGSFISLLGFILGAAAGTLLTRRHQDNDAIGILLGTETILLLGAAALWFLVPHRGRLPNDALIFILSIAMGLQAIIGKKINLSSIPTVVFTSTLTNIVISVTECVTRGTALPADTRRQLVSFGVYFIGAFSAGLLVFFNFRSIILLPLAAAAAALCVHLRKKVAG